MKRTLAFAVVAIVFLGGSAWTQDADPSVEPGRAVDSEERPEEAVRLDAWIDELVSKLGEVERVRVSAEAALVAIGEPAEKRLEVLKVGDDPAMAEAATLILGRIRESDEAEQASLSSDEPPSPRELARRSAEIVRGQLVAELELDESQSARLAVELERIAVERIALIERTRAGEIDWDQYRDELDKLGNDLRAGLSGSLNKPQVEAVMRRMGLRTGTSG